MPTLAEITASVLAQPAQAAPAVPQTPAQVLSTADVGAHPGPAVAFSFVGEPTETYLTELVTGRELASLAAKLTRAPSENKQSLGRALFHALRGEPFAPQGHRNKTAFQLAGEIIEEYPNANPESVLACLSAAVSRVQMLGSKLTEQTWLGMLERMQDERRSRLNMVKHVAGKLGRSLRERAAAVASPMPTSAPEIALAQNPAGRIDPGALNTLFILADGTAYLRRPDEACYRWALKSDRAIAVELANQFGTDNSTVFTHNDKGEALPLSELMPVYASNAHRIVHDYSSAKTTWTPATATLHVGMPDTLPEPVWSDRVHRWASAMAGDSEADTTDLYDWIAAATREHITHPAAALVIVGDTGTGKSLMALALAATWGTLPVDLANAVERFNGSLLLSPFWWADEKMPADLTEDKFRKLIQERSRLVEPKGREKVELHGCGRMVCTLNEPEDLKLGKLSGPSALKAVVDRLSYFDCTPRTAELEQALATMRLGPGHPRPHDVDFGEIVAHLRAVQVGLGVRPQRFLGARSNKSEAHALVLQQGVGRSSEKAVDAMIEYLRDPTSWERSYHIELRQFSTGQRYPAVTQDGWLWINPREFAQRTELRDHEMSAYKQMLRTLRPDTTTPKQLAFGNRSVRAEYWPIDPDKLASAAGVDLGSVGEIVTALMCDTRDRLQGAK